MLTLLEECVTRAGGTYAIEDTDSMAIVSTKRGGPVPCQGGALRTRDGKEAIWAVSWKDVETICARFKSLCPYRADCVPGSILKIEDVNYDQTTGKQRQLYCYAISAKRYAFFLKNKNGEPVMLRKGVNAKENGWKEHGLGHLLNPTDLDSENRDWIGEVWHKMIRKALGLSVSELSFGHLPAIGRVTISSAAVMKAFKEFNRDKPYPDQIKPSNFLVTAQIAPFRHPPGVDPKRFHLIAPFEKDPEKWLTAQWINQYTGKPYRITTEGDTGSRTTARVKTYDDVLIEYEYHPESKCADGKGDVCTKQTVGLLQRRHIQIDEIAYIGKESNRLEEVEEGSIQDEDEVYTEYVDPRRDQWATKIRPTLQNTPWKWLCANTPFSARSLTEWRAGRRRPNPKKQELLKKILKQFIDVVPEQDPNRILGSIAHLIRLFQ